MSDGTMYRIEYTWEYEKMLKEQGIFKHIDDYVLCDIDEVKSLIAENVGYGSIYVDEIQDRATITDRKAAAAYVKAHRDKYYYMEYETGRIDRLLCVEISDTGKTTAALYDHPEHGLIWLDMR